VCYGLGPTMLHCRKTSNYYTLAILLDHGHNSVVYLGSDYLTATSAQQMLREIHGKVTGSRPFGHVEMILIL